MHMLCLQHDGFYKDRAKKGPEKLKSDGGGDGGNGLIWVSGKIAAQLTRWSHGGAEGHFEHI